MIKTVLMDIDNTVLDFDRCAESSIRQGLAELGIPCPEGMFPVFREINDILWREIEKGNLTRPGLRAIRWPWIFDRFAIDADGEAFEDRFVQLLWESHESVDGAEDLLRHLSARYALYAASNAPAGEQEHRLRLAGFLKIRLRARMARRKDRAAILVGQDRGIKGADLARQAHDLLFIKTDERA